MPLPFNGLIYTYFLAALETVCFETPKLLSFAKTKPKVMKEPQNPLFPHYTSKINNSFVIYQISNVKRKSCGKPSKSVLNNENSGEGNHTFQFLCFSPTLCDKSNLTGCHGLCGKHHYFWFTPQGLFTQ